VVEVVKKAAEETRTDLTKADVRNGLRAARVTFADADVIPAVLVAAQRGVVKAEKLNPQRWAINAVEADPAPEATVTPDDLVDEQEEKEEADS
jgi:hypothetical protein